MHVSGRNTSDALTGLTVKRLPTQLLLLSARVALSGDHTSQHLTLLLTFEVALFTFSSAIISNTTRHPSYHLPALLLLQSGSIGHRGRGAAGRRCWDLASLRCCSRCLLVVVGGLTL